ncbi:hypothetical protein ACLOJK_007982 [Asimina triloba]
MEGANYHVLNDDCKVRILSLTSPRDLCSLCAVSKSFRSEAESDAIWERFLPSDWRDILPRFVSSLQDLSSLKQLYFLLCQPRLIDHGKRCLWLEKSSGKKCLMVSPRDLMISWRDDERYWQWNPAPADSSVFPEVAELIKVWWFDIRGTINKADLSPNTKYAVRFLMRHTSNHYGWEHLPVMLSLRVEDDPPMHEQTVLLCPNQRRSALRPSKEYNGWMHVKVGEFLCDAEGGDVEFRMHELSQYKEGIMVMGVEIRPCSVQEMEESSDVREDSNGEEDSEGSIDFYRSD